MENSPQTEPLVVLFDDERSFVPGFRDGAVVIRRWDEALEYFAGLKASGKRISELWLDFVLHPGTTLEGLQNFPGEILDRAIFHSSAWDAHGLVEDLLRRGGYSGELEQLWDAYPTTPRSEIFS